MATPNSTDAPFVELLQASALHGVALAFATVTHLETGTPWPAPAPANPEGPWRGVMQLFADRSIEPSLSEPQRSRDTDVQSDLIRDRVNQFWPETRIAPWLLQGTLWNTGDPLTLSIVIEADGADQLHWARIKEWPIPTWDFVDFNKNPDHPNPDFPRSYWAHLEYPDKLDQSFFVDLWVLHLQPTGGPPRPPPDTQFP